MDSKQAIKILHNNQYQKHLGNGEYDYIHPLTDAEVKGIEDLIERQAQEISTHRAVLDARSDTIESQEARIVERDKLIERQERMIERACERLESGGCLFEDEPCPKNYIEVGCRGCARRWLEEEA